MRNIILLFFLINLSCSNKIDTSQFYIKASEFNPSKTYKYQSLEDSLKIEYWKISNIAKNEILVVRRTQDGKQIDKLKEVISENGSDLKSYSISINGYDWITATKFYPEKKSLMKWNLDETAIYDGQFIVNDIIYGLKREREFHKKTQFEYDNIEYETLIFKDDYKYDVIENQLSDNNIIDKAFVNFIQYSYFSKNIGLVKYKREFENGMTETMNLIEIQ